MVRLCEGVGRADKVLCMYVCRFQRARLSPVTVSRRFLSAVYYMYLLTLVCVGATPLPLKTSPTRQHDYNHQPNPTIETPVAPFCNPHLVRHNVGPQFIQW